MTVIHTVGESGPEPVTAVQLATAVVARVLHAAECSCADVPDPFIRQARKVVAALAEAGLLGITVHPVRDSTHVYLSTACGHRHHGLCRRVCKWCNAGCACTCHEEAKQP